MQFPWRHGEPLSECHGYHTAILIGGEPRRSGVLNPPGGGSLGGRGEPNHRSVSVSVTRARSQTHSSPRLFHTQIHSLTHRLTHLVNWYVSHFKSYIRNDVFFVFHIISASMLKVRDQSFRVSGVWTLVHWSPEISVQIAVKMPQADWCRLTEQSGGKI